ncbi:MAG: hypothetical protein NTW19_05450 [Planctomycetota bacterium]|nr:hypothetical protein [Planctomycetota bacterium]
MTKIFVVLVAILAVALVALVVPFVARTEDFKDSLDQTKGEVSSLKASLANTQAQLSAAKANESKFFGQHAALKQKLEDDIAAQSSSLNDANAALTQERSKSAQATADLARLAIAEQAHAEITKSLQAELGQRRDELLQVQEDRAQKSALNDRLQSDVDAAKRQLARNQESITVLEEKNAKLESLWARVPNETRVSITGTDVAAESGTPYEPSTAIRGQVTKVQKVDDTTFVQINVGSTDGVAPNMKFYVHHAGQFLGTMVITNVDTKSAAGRLSLSQGVINKGDAVLTGGGY